MQWSMVSGNGYAMLQELPKCTASSVALVRHGAVRPDAWAAATSGGKAAKSELLSLGNATAPSSTIQPHPAPPPNCLVLHRAEKNSSDLRFKFMMNIDEPQFS